MSTRQAKIIIICIFITLFLNGCKTSEPKGNFKTYTSKEDGFSISYPKTWKMQKDTNFELIKVIFHSPLDGNDDNYREFVAIKVFKGISPSFSIDKYFLAGAIAGHENLEDNFEEVESSLLKVNGIDAAKLIYKVDKDIQGMSFDLIQNGFHYTIICTALQDSFDKYKSQFEQICNSFSGI